MGPKILWGHVPPHYTAVRIYGGDVWFSGEDLRSYRIEDPDWVTFLIPDWREFPDWLSMRDGRSSDLSAKPTCKEKIELLRRQIALIGDCNHMFGDTYGGPCRRCGMTPPQIMDRRQDVARMRAELKRLESTEGEA